MLSTFPQSPHCFYHSTKVARKLRKQEREGGRKGAKKEEKGSRKASGLKRKKCNTLSQPVNLYGKFHCIYKIVLRINEWV